jgi:hypothetical protein
VLRNETVLPKLPLDIDITGGDCSKTGREIYEEMIAKLKPTLNRVGIGINLKTAYWDATNPNTTASLVDTWFSNSIGNEYLAIIANFSGEAGKRFDEFKRSFEHIHERLHDKSCTVVWVEPQMHGAMSFLKRVQQFASGWRTTEKPLSHEYDWYNSLQKRKLPCKVLVCRYKRS